MTALSVNMNVAALLRNRRDQAWPSVVDLGRIALEAGAAGLTVHPRPDERHTRPSDVHDLAALIATEFPDRELNVEGYPEARFLSLAKAVRAHQVTLVPDAPDQPTSDHGWDFGTHGAALTKIVSDLQGDEHRVALFVDPDAQQMAHAAQTGAARVELYTGPYGGSYRNPDQQNRELSRLTEAAAMAVRHGLDVNAGHDLTVAGTARLIARIPAIAEVSIGHALFCDALTFGMRETVRRYRASCECAGRSSAASGPLC